MKLLTRSILILFTAFLAGIIVIDAWQTTNYLEAALGLGAGVGGFAILGKGRKQEPKSKLHVAFDYITVALMGVFFLAIAFGGLGGIFSNSQPSINLAQFLLTFWLGGVAMWLVSGVFSFRQEIGKVLFSRQLVYISLSFAAFFLANLLVPPTVPLLFRQNSLLVGNALTPNGKFVTVIIGVPEETVFRGWLAPWLGNISRTGVLGGAIGSAILFVVYHLFAYGTVPVSLMVIFADGLVQGLVALKTGVLATSLANHLGNNAISVGLIHP